MCTNNQALKQYYKNLAKQYHRKGHDYRKTHVALKKKTVSGLTNFPTKIFRWIIPAVTQSHLNQIINDWFLQFGEYFLFVNIYQNLKKFVCIYFFLLYPYQFLIWLFMIYQCQGLNSSLFLVMYISVQLEEAYVIIKCNSVTLLIPNLYNPCFKRKGT